MAQLFPKWTNNLPTILAVGGLTALIGVTAFIWYFFSPEYTEVGYRPIQPVEYSHKLHAGDLGIDCRYCHTGVEKQAKANIPPTQTCMNCHKMVKPDSEKILPVKTSFVSSTPIEWIRVHNLPDFAYFKHSAHINAGIGCISCHGNVAQMDKVTLSKPLSMGWCLDCHRDPAPHLRPVNEVTNMDWVAPEDQAEFAEIVIKEKKINPPIMCSGCHR